MQERREAKRVRLSLPVLGKVCWRKDGASVGDLSATDCFMLAASEVKPNELVHLEIDFGNHLVFVWGRVV